MFLAFLALRFILTVSAIPWSLTRSTLTVPQTYSRAELARHVYLGYDHSQTLCADILAEWWRKTILMRLHVADPANYHGLMSSYGANYNAEQLITLAEIFDNPFEQYPLDGPTQSFGSRLGHGDVNVAASAIVSGSFDPQACTTVCGDVRLATELWVSTRLDGRQKRDRVIKMKCPDGTTADLTEADDRYETMTSANAPLKSMINQIDPTFRGESTYPSVLRRLPRAVDGKVKQCYCKKATKKRQAPVFSSWVRCTDFIQEQVADANKRMRTNTSGDEYDVLLDPDLEAAFGPMIYQFGEAEPPMTPALSVRDYRAIYEQWKAERPTAKMILISMLMVPTLLKSKNV